MTKIRIPKRVTIETIFGCNASCDMCVINLPTNRKKGIMSQELFKKIVDELEPYKDNLEKFDLFGLGEPMLDPFIFERIKYVKEKGFKNIAFSTNADLLDNEKQNKLLETEIDTVLFSIDGTNKETHEAIRRGVKFERVVSNVLGIIKKRDEGNYKTRFIIRFVLRDINKKEWEDFKSFWKSKLSKEKNDMLIRYNMHSWGGNVFTKDTILNKKNLEIEKIPCSHFLNNLYILVDGTVPLCHEDALCAKYNMGNVKNKTPLEIFNSDEHNKIRKVHLENKKTEIELCQNCTILYSEKERKYEQL